MKTFCIAGLLVAALAVTSCSRPSAKTYKAEREPADTAAAPQASSPHGVPQMASGMAHGTMPPDADATTASLAWTAPANWQAGAASPMRLATYDLADAAGKAQVSIVVLQGDGGGELANVNRWRGQLQLDPVAEAQLGNLVQPLDLPAGVARLVSLKGDAAKDGTVPGMLVGILPTNGQTYFVKMTGPAPVLDSQREAFTTFLRSFHPAAVAP